MSVNLKQWLVNPLKNNFWLQFLEAIEEELDLFRDNLIKPLENFFNYRNLNLKENLLNISTHYGYTPDLSVINTIEFLKREIESIGFRKSFKTTYYGYEYIYKSVDFDGQVFILYYDTEKLIRAENGDNITNILSLPTYDQPYKWIAEKNFSDFLIDILTYDSSTTYDAVMNYYDLIVTKQATKHVAPEFFLDRILTVDTKEYLMTVPYLEYLANGIEYNRRAVEVPHPGTQITAFMDTTGYFDSLSGDLNYSIPIIKLKSSIITANYSEDDIDIIKVGTGTHPLLRSDLVGSHPSDLSNPIFEEKISISEITSTPDLFIIQSLLEIQYKENEVIGAISVPIINKNLNRKYIRREGFTVNYQISGIDYQAIDDGNEGISGNHITIGTIDYETGNVQITFDTNPSSETTANYIYNSQYKTNSTNYSNIEITEAGIFNSNGDIIMYMTFPPIEYNPNKFHTSYQFIVIK